jgi:lysyl-tRNA synthetase class II
MTEEDVTNSEEPRGREAEVLKARRDSLEALRARGVEPFALTFEPDAHAAELHAEFASIADG